MPGSINCAKALRTSFDSARMIQSLRDAAIRVESSRERAVESFLLSPGDSPRDDDRGACLFEERLPGAGAQPSQRTDFDARARHAPICDWRCGEGGEGRRSEIGRAHV